MRHQLAIVFLTVGVFSFSLLLVPLSVHSAGDDPSSPSPSPQRVFKHVPKEVQKVASLALALTTVLIALLALIGDREKAAEFYDTFPCSKRLNLARRSDRGVKKVLQMFSAKNSIVGVLLLSIGSTIVCFFGHLREKPGGSHDSLHQGVELAMFIAIGLFLNVLVRAFVFYLSWRRGISSQARQSPMELVAAAPEELITS